MEIQQRKSQFQPTVIDPILLNKKKSQDFCLRKRINKKKNAIQRRVVYQIVLLGNKYFGTKVFGDLMITSSGQMKLCSTLFHVSFGSQKSKQVDFYKDINCFQIKQEPYSHIPFCAVEDALKLVDKQPEQINLKVLFEELAKRISVVHSKIKYLFSCESSEVKNDEQFHRFKQSSIEYLKIIAQIVSKREVKKR